MIKIKKGIDIHLVGEAKKEVRKYEPQLFALKPQDFIGVVPKLHVAEGDEVKVGDRKISPKRNMDNASPTSLLHNSKSSR